MHGRSHQRESIRAQQGHLRPQASDVQSRPVLVADCSRPWRTPSGPSESVKREQEEACFMSVGGLTSTTLALVLLCHSINTPSQKTRGTRAAIFCGVKSRPSILQTCLNT